MSIQVVIKKENRCRPDNLVEGSASKPVMPVVEGGCDGVAKLLLSLIVVEKSFKFFAILIEGWGTQEQQLGLYRRTVD